MVQFFFEYKYNIIRKKKKFFKINYLLIDINNWMMKWILGYLDND